MGFYMKKKILTFSLLLLLFSLSARAQVMTLMINNLTDTRFVATTVGEQFLGVIPNASSVVIHAPFIPHYPTYAVLLEGDNGNNAAIINDGSGPYCSDQLTYHECEFTRGDGYHLTVTLLPLKKL